jgi:hypothetical protein
MYIYKKNDLIFINIYWYLLLFSDLSGCLSKSIEACEVKWSDTILGNPSQPELVCRNGGVSQVQDVQVPLLGRSSFVAFSWDMAVAEFDLGFNGDITDIIIVHQIYSYSWAYLSYFFKSEWRLPWLSKFMGFKNQLITWSFPKFFLTTPIASSKLEELFLLMVTTEEIPRGWNPTNLNRRRHHLRSESTRWSTLT